MFDRADEMGLEIMSVKENVEMEVHESLYPPSMCVL